MLWFALLFWLCYLFTKLKTHWHLTFNYFFFTFQAKYKPSYLLCPRAFSWHPIEKVIDKIKQLKSPDLEEDANIVDEEGSNIVDQDILILYKHTLLTLTQYKKYRKLNDDDEIYEYAKLVGRKCTKKILLYREAVIWVSLSKKRRKENEKR